jgi:arylsulfatase
MFTPMEGNNRVPFIIRWPRQIPEDRESNEIVHEVDTFTTLARFAGAEVPHDRLIDGVDQGDFFRSRTDRSAREGFPIFFGEKLYGAKWRNFKMLLVDQIAADAPALSLSVPRIYDLFTNPQEVLELNLTTTHLWVLRPISKMIRDFQASLKQHPPIPVGTPDPYEPTGNWKSQW